MKRNQEERLFLCRRRQTPRQCGRQSSSQEASQPASARPAHSRAHPLTSVTRKTGERGRGRSAHIEHTSIFNQKEISSPFALVLVAHVVSPATETANAGRGTGATQRACLEGSPERPPGAACDQHDGRSRARNRRRRKRVGANSLL